MHKNDLLMVLNDAKRNDKIFVTGRDSEGKRKLFPVTSVALCDDQIWIQFESKDDAFAAYVSWVGIEAGTMKNFKRDYLGVWYGKLSFAMNHFRNRYLVGKEVEPFIDYNAYHDSIFKTDFHAVELSGHIYIFKKE